MGDIREKLRIDLKPLEEINSFLLNPSNTIINQLLKVIDKHGGVEEINRRHAEAGKLENLMARLQAANSPYVNDLKWLIKQKDSHAFISKADYVKRVTGGQKEASFPQPGQRSNAGNQRIAIFPMADDPGQALHRTWRAYAGTNHPGPQDGRAGGGQR